MQSGNDWEIISTDITEDLHDIEFVNNSVGFIYSYGTGNIYRTTDEGVSWEKNNDFPDIHRITETDKYIWIAGKNGFIAKMKKQYVIYGE